MKPQTFDEWEASLPRGNTYTPRDAWIAAMENAARICEAKSEQKVYQRDSQGACDDCAEAIREAAME